MVLKGFKLVIGGHFAIIAQGAENMLVEGCPGGIRPETRWMDCCQNVTIRNSTFNSLTGFDALVMKASYGAGKFMPLKNVRY